MLSSPTTSLHARQRQHRRQTSTPTAFEGVKMPTMTSQRPAAGHRRGLSLDTRRTQQTSSPVARQSYKQQRIQACPGTPIPHHHPPPPYADGFLASPHATPQAHRFDPASACFDGGPVPFDPYGAQLSLMMQKNQESYGNNMAEAKDLGLYAHDVDLTTPAFVAPFPDSPSGQNWSTDDGPVRAVRRISNGIVDRVHKFETLGMESVHRPMTPPSQNATSYFPPTPMETPHEGKTEARPDRFRDDADESMEETIKPLRRRTAASNVFDDLRQEAETELSPPRSSRPPNAKTFGGMQMQIPDYMDMKVLRGEFAKVEGGGGGGFGFDVDAARSPVDAHHLVGFLGGFDDRHDLMSAPAPTGPTGESSGPSPRTSPHRRTESVASIASAASIASINIEDTKTETGVTVEEIAQYIRSPETTDGKWTCLFEDCGKKFGRKENIKSHVQTHLNDRQYQCPTCKKCFVRQHDLKRHAKIHTGIKPYPCECGNSFARHDALTRHRQRGMCIGAFDGIVRKVVKRGRPRKNRPDLETRLEKAARQRRKDAASMSEVSSVASNYSDSSAPASPEDCNMLDDDMMMTGLPQASAPAVLIADKAASLSSAPMPTAPPPLRPVPDQVPVSSPAVSIHSYLSPEAVMETTLPSNPATPARSVASRYTTPPELSRSSSPPPPAGPAFFDPDFGASAEADGITTAMVEAAAAGLSQTVSDGLGDADEDLLLQFTTDDGLAQLDRESMLMKFDDEFDSSAMFAGDAMFFGSS
ncbi:Metallothionein expression activator [Ophiocordyceps camponoti-floridani]|uniref:pH-response transcription factor pacC/RIM101 n=1 Tax=Ophiocordyceps camponoti-floridani TaxID=2030778 RepID=A0A8H4Q7Q4_9HYPO|nr:Metallothionein expression activator [Ophiocordyceps camponoti-floridani]